MRSEKGGNFIATGGNGNILHGTGVQIRYMLSCLLTPDQQWLNGTVQFNQTAENSENSDRCKYKRLPDFWSVMVSHDLLVDMTSVFCAIVDLLESVG